MFCLFLYLSKFLVEGGRRGTCGHVLLGIVHVWVAGQNETLDETGNLEFNKETEWDDVLDEEDARQKLEDARVLVGGKVPRLLAILELLESKKKKKLFVCLFLTYVVPNNSANGHRNGKSHNKAE